MNLRQIIDILSFILPAIMVLLGCIRLFSKSSKGVNGIIMFLAVILLILGLVRYFILGSSSGNSSSKGPKPVALSVSKHSEGFNVSLENVLTNYFSVTDAFVKRDINEVNKGCNNLQAALDSFKIEELKVDTLIYQTALQPFENVKSANMAIISGGNIAEKRISYNILSNELFSLLSTAKYDMAKLYWLECGKAFGDDKSGNWFSKTEQSSNPYGLENCAELKTTIDFVVADTTKK